MSNQLVEFSDKIAAAVEHASHLVVAIQGNRRHTPSGILWQPDLVLTAEHTLKRDEGLTVLTAAGETIEATVAGRDGSTDLALLRLARPPANAPSLPPAAPTRARPGQLVLVVGRAPESGTQASLGILSAASGEWRTWRGGKLDAYLRLDTSTYPATSGSLAIDADGRMIGMATAGLSRLAPLAVPHSTIARVAASLLTHGGVGRGFLGIGMQPVPLPPAFGIQQAAALIILTVEPDSPAHEAGLIAGDILVSLDGHSTGDVHEVLPALESANIGRTLLAQIVRGGQAREVAVRIGERK